MIIEAHTKRRGNMQMDFKMCVEDIQTYKEHLIKEEKSDATIEKYIRDIYHLYNYLAEDKIICKEVLIAYKKQLIENYMARSTNSMLTAANSFIEFMGFPYCNVKLLKIQREIFRSKEKELTKNEYMRLLKISDKKETQRIHLILQTICATGIRIGELKYFTVEAARKGKIQVYSKGKSRVIFIPGQLCQKLKKYAIKRGIKEGCIFVTRNNKPVDRSNIWTEMKRLCKKAQVAAEKVFPHNLRHLFAITYYKAEKDIMKLADILGHSSIETTRIYIMSTGEEHERQISCLGLLI